MEKQKRRQYRARRFNRKNQTNLKRYKIYLTEKLKIINEKRIKLHNKYIAGGIQILIPKIKYFAHQIKIWICDRSFLEKKGYQINRRTLVICGSAIAGAFLILVCVFALSDNILGDISDQKSGNSSNVEEQTASIEIEVIRKGSPSVINQPMNLYSGIEDPLVSELQTRYMELGYMDPDEPTELYGPATEQATLRFELLSGIEADGHIDDEQWEILFSENAPKFVMSIGMEGTDIEEIQARLRNLGYLDSVPTGYFGTDTQEALKRFQIKNGLSQTGVNDNNTAEKLFSENVVANFITIGEKSEAVEEMQKKLISLGYLTGEADGVFGNATLAAVKVFQSKHDLVVDGYLGYQTKKLLMSGNAKAFVLSSGDEGSEVTKLQNALVKLNYINKSTGYYGSDTVKAVKNFQSINGLSADGAAGAKTLSVLYSGNAKKATTTIKVGQNDKLNAFINAAKSKLGCKYVLGAKGPDKFDCSGLVYWCLNKAGIKQSYMTSVTWRTSGNYKTIKDIDDVRTGDIICFSPHHVGIAISSSTMIDASSSSGKVVQRSFKTSYWRSSFVCARRVF